MRKFFYYIAEMLLAFGWSLAGTFGSRLFPILFIPFCIFFVPWLIYMAERERKGLKDYVY